MACKELFRQGEELFLQQGQTIAIKVILVHIYTCVCVRGLRLPTTLTWPWFNLWLLEIIGYIFEVVDYTG